MPNNEINPTNQKKIAEQIEQLVKQLENFSTLEKQLKHKISTLETEQARNHRELVETQQKLTNLTREKESAKTELEREKRTAELQKKIDIRDLEKKLKQAHEAENEILKNEINQELSMLNRGRTLREAVNKFIKEKCRNERHVPTFTDKCFNVVATPFNWVANKTTQGFALFGFATALPAIFTGLGWMLKAYLTVKTGGAYGVATVAGSMLNQKENPPQQQGGYIAPQQNNLPGSNQSPVIININNPNEKEKEKTPEKL